jgi:predicted component of type VI protein secretion system
MALLLEVISDHRDILGDDYERLFGDDGGTIGRSFDNDWILPDPDRFISSRHATIDHKGGAYYLADVSTNGVYINGEREPVGRGNPRRLFSGDRLRMGDFEFMVKLEEGEDLTMPPPAPLTVVPDHIEQLVPEDRMNSSIMMLDEEEITGNDAFQSALFGTPPADKPVRAASRHAGANPFAPPPEPEKPAELTADKLLDAFLEGMGLSREDIHPSVDPRDIMANAGQVLQEFVNGITELLVCRTNLKSMFRLDQTTVLPRHNNPLKLAENTTDSLKQLLVGKEGEYLGPLDSVREVCRDLKFHHDAVLGGMTSAFSEFVDRFDPEELTENFNKTLNRKPLFNSLNKLKYWELYCDLYPIITQHGTGPFPPQFGEEFVRAYDKHIADRKRGDRVEADPMTSTVVLDRTRPQPGEELIDQVDHAVAEW